MDSATAQVVLKLQLDDVDAILKTLPKTDKNGAVNSERVAFAALGDELLRKWNNLRGQAFARNIVQEENSSREAYKKLLGEEQQAERDHDLACRLSGKPVPQRPAVQHAYAMYKNVADQKSEPVNDKTLADKDLHSDLTSMQTKPSKNGLLSGKKRLAEDDLKPDLGPNSFKRVRVDDAKDEDDNSITPNIQCAQKTCVTCKNERHDGLCPEDKDVKKLMGVAKAKRWQTCQKCKEMVELERGCFHIT
ncbi:hypothetical protein AA0120_g9220 [Alternaria tenuissima]|nr:hypothetical protein AA0120_g9220 [Alternaria tenuissima]